MGWFVFCRIRDFLCHLGFLLPLIFAPVFLSYLTPGHGTGRSTEGFCFIPLLKLKGKIGKVVVIRLCCVEWHIVCKLV